MIIVVMGVAGSGKSTIGSMLAAELDCAFLDADTLHAPASIERMRRGIALTDADRTPWLAAIRAQSLAAFARGEQLVIACSALRQSYRAYLADGLPVRWVYLKGGEALIRSRLERRPGHFASSDLLPSQLETLEEPSDAMVVDASASPGSIVQQVVARLAE